MLKAPISTKNKIVEWIRSYFEENGKNCMAVIGISGGKDSSVCAALCAEALGKERVFGVLMPNGIQKDISDSKALVEHLGIPYTVVNIEDGFLGMKKDIEEGLGKPLSKDATINLPPRLRMSTLYAIAQCLPTGGRVVNTCNYSEDYVGYSTKFGDAAGDFSPLSHFFVSEVLQLGEALGLPSFLVHKTPSDGLSGMSDEEKLGFTYEELEHFIRTGEASEEKKAKIIRLHNLNLHKLLPMPSFASEE